MKSQSQGDSKATQQERVDNWSDCDIWLNYRKALGLVVIGFDPKNDDRKIWVGHNWVAVQDQKTWTEIVKASMNGHYIYDTIIYGFLLAGDVLLLLSSIISGT